MQEILEIIEVKKRDFAELPLFEFMQDVSIHPIKRLSFAPCMAHFIMSFSDLNKYVFRDNLNTSRIQKVVNQYTYEDDNHWPWFIQDIENLGLNNYGNFTTALTSIWGEETRITRQISYQIAGYTFQADPIVKLIVIQVLEAAAEVFFNISRQISVEIEQIAGKEYLLFGEVHVHEETEHVISMPKEKSLLSEIELTDSQSHYLKEIVEQTFQTFSEWTYELLAFAQKHNAIAEENQESSEKMKVCA